jgi:hypothetical protein
MQPEPVCAVCRPAATVSMWGKYRHCTTDSSRYTLAKQAACWCPGWGNAAWVALQRNCMAPGLKLVKVSKEIERNAYLGHAWSAW